LVAANLAATFVKHFGYRVLLVEGDLHRPSLTTVLGLTDLEGINQWWHSQKEDAEIAPYIHKLDDMQLWFLSAGSACDQPSQILQSTRFAEKFVQLVGGFDWVVVDSTPMTPIVDANLWSRLVDGTLLVVREGVAQIKALRMGVKGLDNPKWLGIVLNEASEFDRANYSDQYYGVQKK
jgi:Mrp family chromosome partitioning ATPase